MNVKHVTVIAEAGVNHNGDINNALDLIDVAAEAGADFVKTSTGFASAGATVDDVALMRKTVGPNMGVKASGGIRTWEDFQHMVAAGASRIGTSSGVRIVNASRA